MVDPNGESPAGYLFWGWASKWLDMKGYYIAASFVSHARNFWGRSSSTETPLNYNAGSYVSNTIKNADLFQKQFKDVKNEIAEGRLSGSIEINFASSENRDLHYAFGKIKVNYEAVEISEGRFNITFTIDDIFDFDEFRVVEWLYNKELSFADVANDLGRISQLVKELTPFNVHVEMQENDVEIRKKIRVPREDSLD